MEIKIKITTPKGHAKVTEKRVRPFILKSKKPHEIYTNEEDNQIVWVIRGNVREINKITKNVNKFDMLVNLMLGRLARSRIVKNKMSKEGMEELTDMFINHTNIEVVKKATQEELDEDGKSWWQKVKEKFKKQGGDEDGTDK